MGATEVVASDKKKGRRPKPTPCKKENVTLWTIWPPSLKRLGVSVSKHQAVGFGSGHFGFHSRASFRASAICMAVITEAMRSRISAASLPPGLSQLG